MQNVTSKNENGLFVLPIDASGLNFDRSFQLRPYTSSEGSSESLGICTDSSQALHRADTISTDHKQAIEI